MLQVPAPLTLSGAVHDDAPLLGVIVTVPFGTPAAEVTATETFTGCPGVEGFGDEESVIAVAAAGRAFTTCVVVSVLLANASVAV